MGGGERSTLLICETSHGVSVCVLAGEHQICQFKKVKKSKQEEIIRFKDSLRLAAFGESWLLCVM